MVDRHYVLVRRSLSHEMYPYSRKELFENCSDADALYIQGHQQYASIALAASRAPAACNLTQPEKLEAVAGIKAGAQLVEGFHG